VVQSREILGARPGLSVFRVFLLVTSRSRRLRATCFKGLVPRAELARDEDDRQDRKDQPETDQPRVVQPGPVPARAVFRSIVGTEPMVE
jgi:hypothetical protein